MISDNVWAWARVRGGGNSLEEEEVRVEGWWGVLNFSVIYMVLGWL